MSKKIPVEQKIEDIKSRFSSIIYPRGVLSAVSFVNIADETNPVNGRVIRVTVSLAYSGLTWQGPVVYGGSIEQAIDNLSTQLEYIPKAKSV
jgi:hypothetical protein